MRSIKQTITYESSLQAQPFSVLLQSMFPQQCVSDFAEHQSSTAGLEGA